MTTMHRTRNALRLARLGVAMARNQPLPFSVTFVLTHRCNFRCQYCDIPDAATEEMSREEFFAAIDELTAAGMARASFSGGEALVRPDTVDIIAHAHNHGLFTSLNSNGWLIGPWLNRLAPVLNMLVLSLDGPEHIHDAVRQRRGSYARVIDAIDEARARGITVATITVLGPWNTHEETIEEILELARKHQFWAYFQPAYRHCFDLRDGWIHGFQSTWFEQIAVTLSNAAARGLPVGSSPGFFERLRRGPNFGDCTRCAAGKYFATVMPEGWVVPCHLTSRTGRYLNGRTVGFARAFFEMPRPPPGPGCAISPYQESDLIFSLDRTAITTALRRLTPPGNKP